MKFNLRMKIPDENKMAGEIFDDEFMMFFGEESARQMTPFVPRLNGLLFKNYVVTTEYVEYQQPYAHRQYNGKGFNFTKDYHPLATAEWDKAMMRTRKERLVRALQKHLDRRG